MKRIALSMLMAAGLVSSAYAADPITIVDIAELSGSGAITGVNWKNGADMAAAEINAKGGLLGRKIEISHFDNQSNPGISRALMQKAVDSEPYVILGPVSSGAVKSSMQLAQNAEIAEFIGGEAADLTMQGNAYLFRTSFGGQSSMPKLANYLRDELKAKRVAIIWTNNDFGKGGRDAMTKVLKDRNMEVAVDVSTESGQPDFSADVVKLKNSNPDVVFAYMNEEESARFMREYRKQNIATPLVGETTLLGQKVIELAGPAANGARGHVGLSAEAPVPAIQAFKERFVKAYGYNPDHNCIKGYTAIYAIKAVTEKMGKVDQKNFAKTLHAMKTIKPEQEPNILLEVTWDENGDVDRQSFLAEVVDGKQTITKILPKLNP